MILDCSQACQLNPDVSTWGVWGRTGHIVTWLAKVKTSTSSTVLPSLGAGRELWSSCDFMSRPPDCHKWCPLDSHLLHVRHLFLFNFVRVTHSKPGLDSGNISARNDPYGKVGLTNVRIQWNPVYKAFRRMCCCGNETNCQNQFKRDLDAANLRQAVEHGCRKQSPSASILFFRGARQTAA